MPFADIKLIATDVDGTLLNSRHELSPDFYALFEQLKARQVVFSVASGRQYHNLRNRFASIADRVVFIAENGSYVVWQDEQLLVQALAPGVVTGLLERARQLAGVRVVLCGKRTAYIEEAAPEFRALIQKFYDAVELVPDLREVAGDEFLKIALWDARGAETHLLPHFAHLQGELQVMVSGQYWLDIAHGLASKGRALAALQQQYGIAPAQTMVFGDYLNDLDMMQQAQFSYAMANAHPRVKQAARYQARSNDEFGVAAVLAQVLASMNAGA
ncbi:HAD family hydrolase [Hymenobacter latericus]|uniref:HAD family hydrolase n=1 Tax=Hymenobacter sp. YIM 151858-1 TaxID=2987688 RepID=UPI0022260A44|nr:HAD family hydrolase [Hymenobacter sp. YIM 151858-1]UYZ60710.1 Cof-type HAD-IIB family hydrolase [Hymenobacter sp. YIM 151858-1]